MSRYHRADRTTPLNEGPQPGHHANQQYTFHARGAVSVKLFVDVDPDQAVPRRNLVQTQHRCLSAKPVGTSDQFYTDR